MGSVLGGDIANKFAKDRTFSITGTEGKEQIFEILGNNGSLKLCLDNQLYFEDATFIESPVLLNLADSIRFSTTEFDGNGDIKKQVELLGKAFAMEYMKDLVLKLTTRNTRAEPSKIVDEVREIIKGDFYYDREERDFVFEKGDQTFKGGAIASGIKYLGMVCILLLAGFIDKKSLLVIDEPETHMHPQWQIRFAEVLVKLVKAGNHILLTSHSPYFVEAIKIFSDKFHLEEKTAFYLGEREKTTFTSRLIDVTHDISPIFELLAEPYEKLELIQSSDEGE